MELGSLAEWVGAIGTIGSLLFILKQIKEAKSVARNEFLLSLDNSLRNHKDIYEELINSKIDANALKDPETESALWSYIGFFERIHLLRKDHILDISDIHRLYGYRIEDIVKNEYIYAFCFIGQKERWQDFIRLVKDLALYQQSIGFENKNFQDAVDELTVIPTKSEIDWRYGGRTIITYDQPEFMIVARKNPHTHSSLRKEDK